MKIMDLIEIGARVREVRKELNMTQAEFGEKIGIPGPSVLNIELARNKNLQENTLKLICATFGVDYFWLTTGEGDMSHESSNPVIDRINDLMEGENETAKRILRAFAEFSDDDWKLATKFVKSLLGDNKKDAPN
jgi:Predicted transcriptional regulators